MVSWVLLPIQWAGPKAQRPNTSKRPKAQRENLNQAPKSHTKRATSLDQAINRGRAKERANQSVPLLQKGPPEIQHVQEASESVQLFLWYISVWHFCQLTSVFDPLSGAIFSQGKSFPITHRHTGICSSRVGHLCPPPHQGQAGAGWHSQFVFVYSLPLAAASFHSLSLWVGKAALICLCYEISLKHCAFHSVSTCLPWRSQKIFLICCLARLPPTPPFCLWVGFPWTWVFSCFPVTSAPTYTVTTRPSETLYIHLGEKWGFTLKAVTVTRIKERRWGHLGSRIELLGD